MLLAVLRSPGMCHVLRYNLSKRPVPEWLRWLVSRQLCGMSCGQLQFIGRQVGGGVVSKAQKGLGLFCLLFFLLWFTVCGCACRDACGRFGCHDASAKQGMTPDLTKLLAQYELWSFTPLPHCSINYDEMILHNDSLLVHHVFVIPSSSVCCPLICLKFV